METAEGNKLIDIFFYGEESGKYYENLNNYHKHWELLMPVVEKISNKITGCIVSMDTSYGYNKCLISNNNISMPEIEIYNSDTLLGSVWLAVVQFIQWYNANK